MTDLQLLGPRPRLDVASLRERFDSGPPVTRFAPSVTGSLHLGHVVNACWTWGLARSLGGRVLLRLEDHDRSRHRQRHEAMILEELDWLGLAADEPSTDEFRAGASAYRQSDHPERYESALEYLSEAGLVYACDCSRKQIAERRGPAEPGELRYDGHCRERDLARAPGHRLRVRLPDEELAFDDAFAGRTVQRPSAQCGDLLVRDDQGSWTYQACVTIDDLSEGVDLVVRGRDLLDSTGRQVLLARALGREDAALFAHHPLIGDAGGSKLSKSRGDACVAAWREAGRSPAELLGHAAWLGGLQARDLPLSLDGVIELVGSGLGTT